MKVLRDSDFFDAYINHDNAIMGKIGKILSGTEKSTVILNKIIWDELTRKLFSKRKERVVVKISEAIRSGNMIIFCNSPDAKLPDMVPFVVYKKQGIDAVAINASSLVIPVKNPDGTDGYEIEDINKMYVSLYSGYLAMMNFKKKDILPSHVLYDAAVIWAEMFNKPLYDTFGMGNQDRNEALMYFAVKFFLRNIMECDMRQTEALGDKFIQSTKRQHKNDLILYMEEQIEFRKIDIYKGMIPFMETLFNEEITKIRGVKVSTLSNTMNVSYYIQKFTTTFSSNALLALCTFPYFFYVIDSAVSKTKMVKDKSFDRIFQNRKREVSHFLVDVVR